MQKRKAHHRRDKPTPGRPGPGPAGRGAAWLYGEHAVLAALANPARRHRRLLLTAAAAQTLAARGLVPPLEPQVAERAEIDALLPEGAVHQGFALACDPLPEPDLGPICAAAPADAVIVLLDQVSDPQNLGAVMRSAAAFGALAVVTPERRAAGMSGAVAKAASGAADWLPLVRVANLSQAIAQLQRAGFWCLGLDSQADAPLATADLGGRVALVLGSEGRGLRPLTRSRCDALYRLPTQGRIADLNLSNAAAVALYEWARRRQDAAR